MVFGLTEELFDADGSVYGAHDIVPALDGAFSGSDAHAQVLDLEDRTLLGYAWNKVYRAEVLDGIAFETVPLIEDIVFNVAVFNRVENLALVARPLYRYEKRVAANLTAKFVPEYYECIAAASTMYTASRCRGASIPPMSAPVSGLAMRATSCPRSSATAMRARG